MAAAHPAQRFETFPSGLRRKIRPVQCLVNRTRPARFDQPDLAIERGAYLVNHIDKGLDVVPAKVTE